MQEEIVLTAEVERGMRDRETIIFEEVRNITPPSRRCFLGLVACRWFLNADLYRVSFALVCLAALHCFTDDRRFRLGVTPHLPNRTSHVILALKPWTKIMYRLAISCSLRVQHSDYELARVITPVPSHAVLSITALEC